MRTSFKAIQDGAGNDITPLFYWCEAKPLTEPQTNTNEDNPVVEAIVSEDESKKDKESDVQIKSPGKQLFTSIFYIFLFFSCVA